MAQSHSVVSICPRRISSRSTPDQQPMQPNECRAKMQLQRPLLVHARAHAQPFDVRRAPAVSLQHLCVQLRLRHLDGEASSWAACCFRGSTKPQLHALRPARCTTHRPPQPPAHTHSGTQTPHNHNTPTCLLEHCRHTALCDGITHGGDHHFPACCRGGLKEASGTAEGVVLLLLLQLLAAARRLLDSKQLGPPAQRSRHAQRMPKLSTAQESVLGCTMVTVAC